MRSARTASSSAEKASSSPLHSRIDQAIESSHTGPLAPLTDDADFLRRLYLDLTGIIPPAEAAMYHRLPVRSF